MHTSLKTLLIGYSRRVLSCLIVFSFVLQLHTSQAYSCIEIPDENVYASRISATKLTLSYDLEKSEFLANIDGKSQNIKSWNVSGVPKNISEIEIEKFFKTGYFYIDQLSDGELSLKYNTRLLGGTDENRGSWGCRFVKGMVFFIVVGSVIGGVYAATQ
jgi:hypothetical protein